MKPNTTEKKRKKMPNQFWRSSLKGRITTKQLVASAAVLALVVGALTTSMLVTRHAAAAPRQQHSTTVSLQPQNQSGTIQRLETFMISGSLVYHQWSDDNGVSWSSWISLGPNVDNRPFTGTPAVVSDGVGRLTVFALVNNDVLYFNTYANGQWQGWQGHFILAKEG
jgi:hypothetical protein